MSDKVKLSLRLNNQHGMKTFPLLSYAQHCEGVSMSRNMASSILILDTS